MRTEGFLSRFSHIEVHESDNGAVITLREESDGAFDGIRLFLRDMRDVEQLERLAEAAHNCMVRSINEQVAHYLNLAADKIPVELRARYSDLILEIVEDELRNGTDDIDTALDKALAAAYAKDAQLKVVS